MIKPTEHLLSIQRIAEQMGERGRYVCLDRNERVTPFPQNIFREMVSVLNPGLFCAYPDPSPLYERLSRNLGIPEDYLYLTNGSDAAIRMTFQTYVRPGDIVLLADPTYAMFSIYSRIYQAKTHTVNYDLEMHLDMRSFFEILKDRPRLIIIANPNQPTGSVIPHEALHRLAIAANKVGTLFMIDEAYYPFHPKTIMGLVSEFDNVVVTRTFSKVWGLAGLRLGYFAAHPQIVSHIQRIRGAHEVNAVAIALGSYMLDHPKLSEEFVSEIEAGRTVLEESARNLGLGFPPCYTNFQLIRFKGIADTREIVMALKSKGYLVKGAFAAPSVRDCIRVTLAGPEVMRGFTAALAAVVQERVRTHDPQ